MHSSLVYITLSAALATLCTRAATPFEHGYEFTNDGAAVQFIYHPPTYGLTHAVEEEVWLAGPFNNWRPASPGWEMTWDETLGAFTLVKPTNVVAAAGESGLPEFKFVVGADGWQQVDHLPGHCRQGINLWIDFNAKRPRAYMSGYAFSNDMAMIRFVFVPGIYGTELSPTDTVHIAATFSGWINTLTNPAWRMTRNAEGGTYELVTNTAAVNVIGPSGYPEFKYLTGAGMWQQIDTLPDEYVRNNNLWVNFDLYGDITAPRPLKAELVKADTVHVTFSEPVDRDSAGETANFVLPQCDVRRAAVLAEAPHMVALRIPPIDYAALDYKLRHVLTVAGVSDTNAIRMPAPVEVPLQLSRGLLEEFFSGIPATTNALGCIVGEERVTFRVFGPRLDSAELWLYGDARMTSVMHRAVMQQDEDYVWHTTVSNRLAPHGAFYKYVITREGVEHIISDPYAFANVHSSGPSIVIDPDVNDPPFTGWTDNTFTTPPPERLVVYETHLANLTGRNPVVTNQAHRYLALTVDAPGSPLRHLIDLGINAVELLPIHEFNNGSSLDFERHYHWGYMTTLFLAPESSLSSNPEQRRQVSEFKALVDALHAKGLAVIIDVVYNHTSNGDNYLAAIDPAYYFTGGNLSGCGNDTHCGRALMQKLIVDSLCHFVREYHVDGFRFDLSHLINQEELLTPENMAVVQAAKPTAGPVLWIMENWAQNRATIKSRGAAQWNDWFREDIKNYVALGEGTANVPRRLEWSSDRRAYAGPLETVNYCESHDENTIAYRIIEAGTTNRGEQMRRARLGGLIQFVSQGIPMLREGQEMFRNTPAQIHDYERNMVDWSLVEEYGDLLDYYTQLIALRMAEPVLRSPHVEPDGFWRVINGDQPSAVGAMLNSDSRYTEQPRYVALFNAGDEPATFTLPAGDWQVVIDAEGFVAQRRDVAETELTIEAGSGWLLSEPPSGGTPEARPAQAEASTPAQG